MKEKIIKILSELRPEFDFSKPFNFIEDGMLDSFDIINLVNAIESNFNVMIPGVEILPENFSSIDSIENLIKKSSKK